MQSPEKTTVKGREWKKCDEKRGKTFISSVWYLADMISVTFFLTVGGKSLRLVCHQGSHFNFGANCNLCVTQEFFYGSY